jgi:bifunctional non-homologous end joining protein LigD
MPFIQPMPLGRKPEPFDHPEWIYELKYDGFRAVAVVDYGRCTLLSRNGHPFASFSQLASRIGYALMPRSVVLDGEIVCLDQEGRC